MASTNDNLIGVVGMPFVADVIEPGDVHAIACAPRSARRRAGAARVHIGSFSQSRQSARTVPAKRSATAFAFRSEATKIADSLSEDGVEVTRELAVAVADEEAKRRRSGAQRPGELAACRLTRGPLGFGVQPARCTRRLPRSLTNPSLDR